MTTENNNTEDMIEIDGEFHLPSECCVCADGEMRLRRDCVLDCNDEWQPTDECVELTDGSTVREDSEDIVYLCNGDYCWRDDAILVDGDWYPEDEACVCEWCDTAVLNDDSYCTEQGSVICRDCRDNDTFTCDRCGEICHNNDEHCEEDEDGDTVATGTCHSCNRRRNPPPPQPPRLILGYHDKSANRLIPESKDSCLFGIELEVESKNLNAEDGARFTRLHLPLDYAVFKHDGSLGAGGFEIVTRPDSVSVHRRYWDVLFSHRPADHLRSWNTGRCGMHVHISRAALSQLQIGKMMCFLADPGNRRFVERVAGRKSSGYSKILPKKVGSALHYDPDRYVALNTTGDRTVEVRIFKGSLNPLSFYKNLEFCQALVDFTAPAQRSVADATNYGAFLRWVSYKEYPSLYDWLVKRNWILDRRPRKRAG